MKILVTPSFKKASTSYQLLLEKTMFAVLLLFFTTCLHAQDIAVKGRLTTDAGEPVADASVTVKGKRGGVKTNADGYFEISAPANATLVASSVGFSPKEIPVSGRNSINVTLTRNVSNLDQVVVIGYGTQRKKDVTGSTISVKGETLNEIKAPNILNQLQGRAAGVDIVSNSTQLGAGGQIRIRGNRSITGNNDPLIVVDGMAYGGSVNDINPDNIANIDILKDASATAIYGSRGANGVIIITTKRGFGQKAVTTYSGYVGTVKAIDTWRVFSGAEYAQFKLDAAAGNSNVANANSYSLRPIEATNLAAGVSTDWQRLLLKTGIRTSHDLNVRGGNDRTQYSFGGGYYSETGIIYDQALKRYSFTVNIDHKLSERIKVGFTSFNTLLRSDRLGTNAYGAATRLGPLFKPYNDDGTLNFKPASQQGVDDQQINPLTSIGNNDIIKAFSRRYQFQHNFYGEVKILKDLKFKTTFGYGWSQTLNDNYTGPNTVFNTNATTAGSTLSQQNSEGWQYTVNNSLDYNRLFGSKHKLQVLALQEIQKNHFQQQQFNGQGVPADFIQDYNFQLVNTITAAAPGQGTSFSESALIGYMGRAIYSFDDKYLLTATVRTDGASVLAKGHQWVTYPAVSVGWNIDREKFMEGIRGISSLKIRAGWGISSNSGVGAYSTLGSLTSNFYNFGSGTTVGTNFANGYIINTSPNPDLTWEKTKGLNIGIDFGLFNNRVSGSIEYYNTKTDDILLQRNLPRSNGTNSILTNVGATASHGMELSLSTLNIKNNTPGGFSWRTDYNAYFNREKITALQNGLLQDINNGWFVGQPITVIYDVKKIGIWQTSEAAQATVYGAAPGDIKLEDVDKNNAIGASDRQIIGNFQPSLVAGLTNHFEYKNFDLNVVMFGRFGQKVVATYLSADGGGAGYPFFLNSRVNQLKVDYWTPNNPTNAFPQPDAGRDGLLYTSTLTYRDGSFIKMRSIDLGYNLPPTIFGKSGIQSLRVYVSAQNPFIIWAPLVRDNLGIDPEGNGTGNSVNSSAGGTPVQTRAITVGMGVPPSRLFIIGVNLKF
ncbi:MAG TPA: TonB-dependent receptor [Chitinophagaceae bacterium]|nr:TonB-dependent receptor [Chitinophagaceae bacterium]